MKPCFLPSTYVIQTSFWLDGRKPSGLLATISGWPQSDFRKNRKWKSSTLKQLDVDIFNKLKEDKSDFSLEDLPSRKNGYPSHFEDFLFVYGGQNHIPLTTCFAVKIDKLDSVLSEAYEERSLKRFKSAMLNCDWLDKDGYWVSRNSQSDKLRADFCSAQDLEVTLEMCKEIFINIFFSFLSALDIEFCSAGLGTKLKLRPLFLDLIPKANLNIEVEGELKLPAKDRFRLPVRRLLELTHAIFYYSKYEKWPEKAVGRNELAKTIGYEETIGGFFDGTKKLTLAGYRDICKSLDDNLGNRTGARLIPLFISAIVWQHLFVNLKKNYKIQSVISYDGVEYKRWWDFHHKEWASHLQSGANDWPTWLDG